MAEILPFKKPARGKPRGDTLCRQGHHKYRILTERKFDVKQGKLVTVWECARCGKKKVEAI